MHRRFGSGLPPMGGRVTTAGSKWVAEGHRGILRLGSLMRTERGVSWLRTDGFVGRRAYHRRPSRVAPLPVRVFEQRGAQGRMSGAARGDRSGWRFGPAAFRVTWGLQERLRPWMATTF